MYYESFLGDVGEVFDIDRDYDGGYCRPMCSAGCPKHYVCSDGMFCTPDSNWARPVLTVAWTGAAEGSTDAPERLTSVPIEFGKAVELSATATSPLGLPIETFEWNLIYGARRSEEMISGRMVTFMLAEGDGYGRVELSVHDSEARTTMATVSFDGCYGAGHVCGYQGSGCCASCDKASNTCL